MSKEWSALIDEYCPWAIPGNLFASERQWTEYHESMIRKREVLNRAARAEMEASPIVTTTPNDADIEHLTARAKLISTLNAAVAVGILLGVGWSVWAWVTL